MKTRRFLIRLSLLLGFAVGLGAVGLWGYRRVHPASLDAWTAGVAAPDFELRYRSRTRTHYVAIFEVGPDRLAFCRKRIDGDAGRPEPAVRITDLWGNDLVDPGRPREQLFRVWHLGLTDYEVDDGELVPIRPGFSGRMRIVFDTRQNDRDRDAEQADPDRLGVLDTHIYWGKRG